MDPKRGYKSTKRHRQERPDPALLAVRGAVDEPDQSMQMCKAQNRGYELSGRQFGKQGAVGPFAVQLTTIDHQGANSCPSFLIPTEPFNSALAPRVILIPFRFGMCARQRSALLCIG
jgi:hypothetical protein